MNILVKTLKRIKKILSLAIIFSILIIVGLVKFGVSPITSIRYIRESYNYVFHGTPFEKDIDY